MTRRNNLRNIRLSVLAIIIIILIYKFFGQDPVKFSDFVGRPTSDVEGTSGGLKADSKVEKGRANQVLQYDKGLGKSYKRANAAFVTLCRNEDIWSLLDSIRMVEDRFNHNYHYDWIFLNDKEFTEDFKNKINHHVSGKAKFGLIPRQHWGFPDWINKDKAAAVREQMRKDDIIYGDSISYRHMCRYESGFFWRHPLLDDYKYYWRVEPDIKYYCDIDYDLFKYMEENKLKYGFTVSLYEYEATIKTLWNTTKEFISKNPQYLAKNNLIDFVSNDKGETYNLCHFWSNFEIASLDFLRGDAYRKYFDYLDKSGGFFYERWGDAPVHSIAAALFLDKDEVHYFEDVGYWHVPFNNCPADPEDRLRLRCTCDPKKDPEHNFAWSGWSCLPKYYKAKGLPKPKGVIDETGK